MDLWANSDGEYPYIRYSRWLNGNSVVARKGSHTVEDYRKYFDESNYKHNFSNEKIMNIMDKIHNNAPIMDKKGQSSEALIRYFETFNSLKRTINKKSEAWINSSDPLVDAANSALKEISWNLLHFAELTFNTFQERGRVGEKGYGKKLKDLLDSL